MKDQFCLRSIPDDLWDWLRQESLSRSETINSLVIALLDSTKRHALANDVGLPLFPDRPIHQSADIGTLPFRFIDLFAGVGGFRLGLQRLGGQCVFSCERDKFSAKTYEAWFGERPHGDINDLDLTQIPDHDVLTAGFPCQPFSVAGVSKKRSLGRKDGFECEEQGNLFFRICDVVAAKRPPVLMLENVKNLKSHDKGRTWPVIESTLDELGYTVFHQIIDAAGWVPQHRERIFIVCFDRAVFGDAPDFHFPVVPTTPPAFGDILETSPPAKYTLSDHLWQYLQDYAEKHRKKGNGFGYGIADPKGVSRTLSARYHKDGSEILIKQRRRNPRRLTIVEAARLMGFDEVVSCRDDVPVSDTQAYRQFGNAVVPAVVHAVGTGVVDVMKRHLQNDPAWNLLGRRSGSKRRKRA